MRKTPLLVYSLLGLYTIAPLLGMVIAVVITSACNCELDVNKPRPCLLGGRDIGRQMADLALSSMLFLFTLPTGGLAIIIYTLVLARIKASPAG